MKHIAMPVLLLVREHVRRQTRYVIYRRGYLFTPLVDVSQFQVVGISQQLGDSILEDLRK